MRAHVRTILLAALTVGLMAVFLRSADFGLVWREIRAARIDLVAAAVLVTGVTYFLRALRWQWLLRGVGHPSFANALRATIVGFAATFLLPARAGELLRPYLLARWERFSATAAFATIVLERLLDLVTVLLLLSLFLLLSDPGIGALDPVVFGAVKAGGVIAGLGAVVALVLVFLLAARRHDVDRLSRHLTQRLPERFGALIGSLITRFVQGLAVMRRPRELAGALALSVPLWLAIALDIWLVAVAFHITLPFSGSFLLVALLVVGVSVPTPGAVGGFHEAFRIGATSFFAAPNDRAIGAALVLHAVSFIPVTIAGVALMAQAGLNLKQARQLARERPSTDDAVEPIGMEPVVQAHEAHEAGGGAGRGEVRRAVTGLADAGQGSGA